MKTIKGLANPTIRKALAIIFNAMINDRLKNIPMGYEELSGYLNATQDIYVKLTETKKSFKFDKKIIDILNGLKKGKILVLNEKELKSIYKVA